VNYAWIIDRDLIAEPGAQPGRNSNAVGMLGPGDISIETADRLKAGEGVPFRMYDDDNELYYEGRFMGDSESEDAFSPLDDFGSPNAGCTRIDYLRGRKWEQL
jgi:hypothetical protein